MRAQEVAEQAPGARADQRNHPTGQRERHLSGVQTRFEIHLFSFANYTMKLSQLVSSPLSLLVFSPGYNPALCTSGTVSLMRILNHISSLLSSNKSLLVFLVFPSFFFIEGCLHGGGGASFSGGGMPLLAPVSQPQKTGGNRLYPHQRADEPRENHQTVQGGWGERHMHTRVSSSLSSFSAL